MYAKIIKLIAIILLTCALLVGILSIYRATLKTSDLTGFTGKVLTKQITYSTSIKSGRHYSLKFQLENRQDLIAINLGTESQAEKDSAIYLIDTGKTYKFYLDPTVPMSNGVICGIKQVDLNNVRIYKTSNSLDLYGGTFISLLSFVGLLIIIFYKKKNSRQH